MFHHVRVWQISEVPSAEELARLLTEQTWTLCSGFAVAGHPEYLFLNDATCADGAAEYAIIKGGLGASTHRQIESITFSWCSTLSALTYIRDALAGRWDDHDFAILVEVAVQTPAQHGRCHLCA